MRRKILTFLNLFIIFVFVAFLVRTDATINNESDYNLLIIQTDNNVNVSLLKFTQFDITINNTSNEVTDYASNQSKEFNVPEDGKYYFKNDGVIMISLNLESLPDGYGADSETIIFNHNCNYNVINIMKIENVISYIDYEGQVITEIYSEDQILIYAEYETKLDLKVNETEDIANIDFIDYVIITKISNQEYFFKDSYNCSEMDFESKKSFLHALDTNLNYNATTQPNSYCSYSGSTSNQSTSVAVLEETLNITFEDPDGNIDFIIQCDIYSDDYAGTTQDEYISRCVAAAHYVASIIKQIKQYYDSIGFNIPKTYLNNDAFLIILNSRKHGGYFGLAVPYGLDNVLEIGYSHIELDRDMALLSVYPEFYDYIPLNGHFNFVSNADVIKTFIGVIAHEYFHCVSITYVITDTRIASHIWMLESFATFMELTYMTYRNLESDCLETVRKKAINEFLAYSSASLISIDSHEEYRYGAALFPLFLYQEYGGYGIIKDILEYSYETYLDIQEQTNTPHKTVEDFYTVFDDVLTTKYNSSFAEAFTKFTANKAFPTYFLTAISPFYTKNWSTPATSPRNIGSSSLTNRVINPASSSGIRIEGLASKDYDVYVLVKFLDDNDSETKTATTDDLTISSIKKQTKGSSINYSYRIMDNIPETQILLSYKMGMNNTNYYLMFNNINWAEKINFSYQTITVYNNKTVNLGTNDITTNVNSATNTTLYNFTPTSTNFYNIKLNANTAFNSGMIKLLDSDFNPVKRQPTDSIYNEASNMSLSNKITALLEANKQYYIVVNYYGANVPKTELIISLESQVFNQLNANYGYEAEASSYGDYLTKLCFSPGEYKITFNYDFYAAVPIICNIYKQDSDETVSYINGSYLSSSNRNYIYYINISKTTNLYFGVFNFYGSGVVDLIIERTSKFTKINDGESLEIAIESPHQERYLRFTPNSSGYYLFSSQTYTGESVPYLYFYTDSNLNDFVFDILSEGGNFNELHYLEEGITYYITFSSSFECIMAFTISSDLESRYDVGSHSDSLNITAYFSYDYRNHYFKFTPKKSGYYSLTGSTFDGTGNLYVYGSTNNILSNQFFFKSGNFYNIQYLTLGTTYYFMLANSGINCESAFSVNFESENAITYEQMAPLGMPTDSDFSSESETYYYSFTPSETGNYQFSGYSYNGLGNLMLVVYTDNGFEFSEYGNFDITYHFTSGITYYFRLKNYGNDCSASLVIDFS